MISYNYLIMTLFKHADHQHSSLAEVPPVIIAIVYKKIKTLLWIVFPFSNTLNMFTWTSTSSVILTFFRSLKFTFCNLLKSVVFPAPPHPSIMHLTWRTVIFPLLWKSVNFSRSIWIFFLSLKIMHFSLLNIQYNCNYGKIKQHNSNAYCRFRLMEMHVTIVFLYALVKVENLGVSSLHHCFNQYINISIIRGSGLPRSPL